LRPFKTIIQQAGSSTRCKRTASRKRRFIPLRTTAFPRAFVTVNPTLGRFAGLPSSTPACLKQNAAKYGHEKREPSS
jgi:hypothetical protein